MKSSPDTADSVMCRPCNGGAQFPLSTHSRRDIMKIVFDESDVDLVAKAMAKSRGMGECDFSKPFAPKSPMGDIYQEALRVVAALRNKYGS